MSRALVPSNLGQCQPFSAPVHATRPFYGYSELRLMEQLRRPVCRAKFVGEDLLLHEILRLLERLQFG